MGRFFKIACLCTRSKGSFKEEHYDLKVNRTQPLFFFVGIRTEWIGFRKPSEGKQNHTLFAFFTSEPNSVVAPIHPKAMPVILTEPEELDMWMTAPWGIAKELQRPLSSSKLMLQ